MSEQRSNQSVRLAFRQMGRRSAILVAGVALLYAALLVYIGHPQWVFNVALCAACWPLFWLMGARQSVPRFIGALLAMVVLSCYNVYVLTSTMGSSYGFHLVLFVMVPMLAIASVLGNGVKWGLLALFTVYLVWLDLLPPAGSGLYALGPGLRAAIRVVNVAVVPFSLATVVLHYYNLVTLQRAQLRELASIDPLTQLLNRRRMAEVAQRTLLQSRSYDESLSVVLCDLDHFKAVNDRFGHQNGDVVLRHASRVLREGARSADSVGRWGGEEFMLLLPHTDLAGALLLSRRICEAMSSQAVPLPDVATSIPVTVTMGVACRRGDESFDAMVARADLALYAGKKAGRNQVMAESA